MAGSELRATFWRSSGRTGGIASPQAPGPCSRRRSACCRTCISSWPTGQGARSTGCSARCLPARCRAAPRAVGRKVDPVGVEVEVVGCSIPCWWPAYRATRGWARQVSAIRVGPSRSRGLLCSPLLRAANGTEARSMSGRDVPVLYCRPAAFPAQHAARGGAEHEKPAARGGLAQPPCGEHTQ